MQLEEAVKAFEARFTTVSDGAVGPEALPGLPYTVIMSGGPKAEGVITPCYCLSQNDAVRLWLEAAIAFAQDKPYLYWRSRPDMDTTYVKSCDKDGHVKPVPENLKVIFAPKQIFLVYSRFAVAGD